MQRTARVPPARESAAFGAASFAFFCGHFLPPSPPSRPFVPHRGIRGSAFTHISRFVFFAFLLRLRSSPPIRVNLRTPPSGPPEKTSIESIESTESLIAGPVLGKVRARRPRCGRRPRRTVGLRPPAMARCAPRHGDQPVQGHRKERTTHDLGMPAFLCGSVHLCQSTSICGSLPLSSSCLPCPP